jgi:hypothetical protein
MRRLVDARKLSARESAMRRMVDAHKLSARESVMRRVSMLVVLAACGDNHPALPDANLELEVASFPATSNPQLDLLFLIDDSPGGLDYQNNIKNNLAALLGVFETLETYPFDVHIGVATSDLGTTGSLDPAHPAPAIGSGQGSCSGHGKDGRLRTDPSVQDAFVADMVGAGGTHQGNFTGSVTTALAGLLSAGSNGCGFEQHLASIRRALTNPLNAGFIRDPANLAIILVGDEDDCSVHDAAAFFAPGPAGVGPMQSFRCTAHGLTCDQSLDTVGTKTDCRPRTNSPYIDDVAPYVQSLLDFKGDPRKLMFGVDVGNPSPVDIELRVPPGGGSPVLALAHSCSYVDATNSTLVADPAVRDVAAVAALPVSTPKVVASMCSQDQGPQLTEMAKAIKRLIGDSCIDTTKLAPALDCIVEDVRDSDPAHPTAIPACPSGGDCFELTTDTRVCPYTQDHRRVVVHRASPAASDTWTHVRCRIAS